MWSKCSILQPRSDNDVPFKENIAVVSVILGQIGGIERKVGVLKEQKEQKIERSSLRHHSRDCGRAGSAIRGY